MIDQIKNKHILVDGDIYKYRCAASAEKTKYLVEYGHQEESFFDHFDTHQEAKILADKHDSLIWSRKEVQSLEFALQACKTALESLFDKLDPSKVSIFLSPERTFRHDLARTKPYKGNRVQQKPKYLKDVEEYLIREYGATVGDNVEADDEIGRQLSKDGLDAVSVSIDKDLLQIPGWHYDWVNDRVRKVSEREGDLAFYTQLLAGDVTDNIPGLKGMGPVGARKVLSGVRSRVDAATRVWMCYRGEFNDADKAREFYLEQAQLLWILRAGLKEGKQSSGQYVCPIELK
jgi:hypothetical protein